MGKNTKTCIGLRLDKKTYKDLKMILLQKDKKVQTWFSEIVNDYLKKVE